MYAVAPVSPTPVEPDIWHALADPTRRGLIDRLASGPRTTSQLCAGWPMSRFGVMKHLGVLERAGLVTARRQGRLRLNYLNAAPLHALQARWLSPRAAAFAAAAQSFSHQIEESQMPASAEQLSHADIALDWEIHAPLQRVWRLIFDAPERWWPAAYRAGPEGSAMKLDERVGGTLREEREDGAGVLWYNVVALDPLRSIDLAGHLASRFGGPATSLLHLELSPGSAEGTTMLRLTDSVFGRLGAEFRTSVTAGWNDIFAGLKGHAERGEG